MSEHISVPGIFKFVDKNRDSIITALDSSIKGDLVNYSKSSDGFFLRVDEHYLCISTSDKRHEFMDVSQGHCTVLPDDRINYSNRSSEVMDIVLELYKIHRRNSIIEQLTFAIL